MDDKRKEYQKRYKEQYKTQAKRIYLTVSNKEYRAFSKSAKGQKISTHVRNLAIAQLVKQTHLPEELKDELQELNRLIRNIANNLNQMAHSANIFRDVDSNQVFSHLIELDKTINQFVDNKLNIW